jgi:hypothetical protein
MRFRERRRLPPAGRPAIVHPATRKAVARRFAFAAAIAVLALALLGGAGLVLHHRETRKADLLRDGVRVTGVVSGHQRAHCGKRICLKAVVEWRSAGRMYRDGTTRTLTSEWAPSVGSLAYWTARLRAVLRVAPWLAATVTQSQLAARGGWIAPPRREAVVSADDPRFPVVLHDVPGTALWVALGPHGCGVGRPGALDLGYRRSARNT